MKLTNQDGIVSLLTAVIISLFVIVITSSAVVLMVGELRQSIDAENSVRAYYAAESGAEDAVLKVKAQIDAINNWDGLNPPVKPTLSGSASINTGCGSAVPVGPASQNISYTCQLISTSLTTPQGKLQREEPLQYDLSSNDLGAGFIKPLDHIEVAWNQADCTDCDSVKVPFSNPSGLPAPDAWTAPALMEVTIVGYPKATQGAVNQNNTIVRTVVLKPNSPGGVPLGTYPVSYNWQSPYASPPNVDCYAQVPQNDYNCRAYISGLNGTTTNYVVRIRPRYLGTSYRLRFYDGAGGVVTNIPDQYATIDVTGKAGDVYRRIVQKVKIRSSAFAGLDYVLYGDQNVCKDFTLSSGTYKSGSCPGYATSP